MLKIGLTGGMGSGKSSVAYVLQMLGYPVYESDREAARITDSLPEIRHELIRIFGPEIYTDHKLNRTLFASLLFNDPQSLKQANSIIHPAVMNDFNHWCLQQTAPLVFMESAIIFEAGLNGFFDVIITVCADQEIRINRVLQRDKTTREEILERISNQWTDEEKAGLSDYYISNYEHDSVLPQLLEILAEIDHELK